MFVKTVKIKKPTPTAIFIVLAIVILVIALMIIKSCDGEKVVYKAGTNEERIELLQSLGWDVSEQDTESKVVTMPKKFNTVYNVYNRLQKDQGFDLSDYKGKTVEIYTYEVYNYPEKPNNILAHLIVFEGKLIGGDICCTELEGFMHGLVPPFKEEVENSDELSEQQPEQDEQSEQQQSDVEDSTPQRPNQAS